MSRQDWFEPKWYFMKRFALMALAWAFLCLAAVLLGIEPLAIGALLIVPLLLWVVVVPLLHWKDRYVGERSTLWGVLLLIETSGWFKLVYWFRHVLPDWRQSGRYEEME